LTERTSNTRGGVQEALTFTNRNLIGSAGLVSKLLTALATILVPVAGIAACAVEVHVLRPREIGLERQTFCKTLLALNDSGVIERIQTCASEVHVGILRINRHEVCRQSSAREKTSPHSRSRRL